MSKYSTHHHRFIDRQCRYAFRNIDAYTLYIQVYEDKYIHTMYAHAGNRTLSDNTRSIRVFFGSVFFFINFYIRECCECWTRFAVVCYTHVTFYSREWLRSLNNTRLTDVRMCRDLHKVLSCDSHVVEGVAPLTGMLRSTILSFHHDLATPSVCSTICC